MFDQAHDLRQLVRAARAVPAAAASTRKVLVAGGKGGVGATTVALRLAQAFASHGPTVLVDACGGALAPALGVHPRFTLDDVLAGRRDLASALHRVDENLRLLAGDWGRRDNALATGGEDRLSAAFAELLPATESVVLDVGCQSDSLARRLWSLADETVVVATAEVEAITGAYAAIKQFASNQSPIRLVVNRADEAAARDAFARVARACNRFLGLTVQFALWLPADDVGPIASTRIAQFAAALAAVPQSDRSRQNLKSQITDNLQVPPKNRR